MNMSASFGSGEVLLWIFELFMFIIWFWLLITIFGDIFRDRELSGVSKALWLVVVLIMPFIGILLYLIVRGGGMADRAAASMQAAQQQFDAAVRDAAGTAPSPADQIATAKSLLDSGAIDQGEFDRLKAKALS